MIFYSAKSSEREMQMIRHVVMFKFRPETGKSEREQVIADLRALPGIINEIREYEVGEDILQSPRSYDAVIVSSFADLGAFEIYQRHPEHVAVALRIRELADAVAAVDYEF